MAARCVPPSLSLRICAASFADPSTTPPLPLQQGRSGVILAVRGLAVFVYNRNIALNEGVFVVSPRSLISLAAAHATKPQSDLAKLNPEIGQYAPLASGIRLQTRRFHDPLLDTPVVVVKGIHKSRIGRITDVNGEVCRVELQSTNQTITVKKDGLLRKECVSSLLRSEAPSGAPLTRCFVSLPALPAAPRPVRRALCRPFARPTRASTTGSRPRRWRRR